MTLTLGFQGGTQSLQTGKVSAGWPEPLPGLSGLWPPHLMTGGSWGVHVPLDPQGMEHLALKSGGGGHASTPGQLRGAGTDRHSAQMS